MIYTVGGQKGGSGKTTVATNLAILLAVKGKDVLLVDADDQETASDFTALREERTSNQAGYTAIKLSGINILKQIPKLAERYEDIVIDTGGRDTESQRAALTVTHVFLIPFVPRSFDIWTLEKVEFLVEQARAANPKLKAYVFINRADPRGGDNDEAAELLRQSDSLTYLDAPLGNRKAFANAAASGCGIIELKNADEKAINEFTILYNQLTISN
jgi:chromosome partitioning protein